MMRESLRNIRYSPAAGDRGVGDLFRPQTDAGKAPVLLIHGGGWNAMSKEAFDPVAPLFLEFGRAVFNINYRLLDHAPWPAGGDDCLTAARFILSGRLATHCVPAPSKILICGGSAGGQLAMMTGLRLAPENVEAIISLSGPSRLDVVEQGSDPILRSPEFLRKFFGQEPTPELIAGASPALFVRPGAPPLFCIHSRNDRLVLPEHSEAAAAAWRRAGSPAEVLLFDGDGDKHGLWDSEDLSRRRVFVPADALIRKILKQLA
jgi:acetyl esterase/lipase